MSEKILSVYEVAELKKVTPVTVYKWIKRGLVFKKEPTQGTKTRIVMSLKDVDDFIQQAQAGKL